MRSRRVVTGLIAVVVGICLGFSSINKAEAQATVLHSFNGNSENDGNEPVGPVVFDSLGNLYGTTFNGGTTGWGTVFKLTPAAGGWSESIFFNFNGQEAAWPTSPLTFDSSGNIYGSTFFGGFLNDGAAFKISLTGSEFTGLHDFGPRAHDGTNPRSGVIFDKLGNAYGTTTGGGKYGNGTVFQLSPITGGGWKEEILHSFDDADGWQPSPGLVMDDAGNLYGTTGFGGSSSACDSGCGVVYEISPKSEGGWSEKVVFNFNNTNGANPFTALTIDADGNLYGMTSAGGLYNWGGVFELSHKTVAWKMKILHNFNSNGVDGNSPFGVLARDSAGNLFGATGYGGAYGVGTVFELSPQKGGLWQETILYNFNSDGGGGYSPGSGPVLDSAGNLYGTTENGGSYGGGTVYEIVR
jgi:uncharacterized repeat protein (TIGR03803 family)